MSATQHSTNEHPYSPAPGSSSGPQVSLRRPACTERVAPVRTEESSVSRRPSRFGGSPGLVGGSLAPRECPAFAFASCGDQPLSPLSRPPRLCPHAVFAAVRTSEGRQDRFPSEHRDAPEAFPTQGDFPRQATRDSARPFQVADRESWPASRRCASRFRPSASLHPRRPPERLRALRGFLW